ncbi:MAG: hypothetical protein R6U50_02480 [Desulfobacterales bacterium]
MKRFTPEELASESRPLSEMALEALAQGNIDRLHALLNTMSESHRGLYYGYLNWLEMILGRIRIDAGEEFMEAVLEQSAMFIMKPIADRFLQGNEKDVFTQLISFWKNQPEAGVLPIRENDETIEFLISPCDSGGRFARQPSQAGSSRLFALCSDGAPAFCHACRSLQKSLNSLCGAAVWQIENDPDLPATCRMTFSKLQAKGTRLFEGNEIYDTTKTRCRQALEKLSRMDFNLEDVLTDHHHEWRDLHDLYNVLVTCLLTAMYKDRGTAYIDDLLHETYVIPNESLYTAYRAMDDITFFRFLVRTWYYHQAAFTIEEEEDRFKFILDPCGSGGRLYRGEIGGGAYPYGGNMLCLMDEPADINFNRRDFPIYCTHCAATNRDQFMGQPWPFIVDGHSQMRPGMPCIQYFYKKDAKREIDAALPAQVGLSGVSPLKEP